MREVPAFKYLQVPRFRPPRARHVVRICVGEVMALKERVGLSGYCFGLV